VSYTITPASGITIAKNRSGTLKEGRKMITHYINPEPYKKRKTSPLWFWGGAIILAVLLLTVGKAFGIL
jgi:hypothetical protein